MPVALRAVVAHGKEIVHSNPSRDQTAQERMRATNSEDDIEHLPIDEPKIGGAANHFTG
jgi:hypothetical protein